MIVRVGLRSADGSSERIYCDLNVGKDLMPLSGGPYFGFYGALNKPEQGNGFILNSNGVIDHGCGFEQYRYNKTNLLARKIELGKYITVWFKTDAEATYTDSEATYVIDAVTILSSVTEVVKPPEATNFHIDSIYGLPRFRARVVRSFDIEGYDGVVYRPPVGVEGDVANFQDYCVFCPDDAVAKDGQMITVIVDGDSLELLADKCDPFIMAGLEEY